MVMRFVIALLIMTFTFQALAKDSEAKLRAKLVQLEELIAAKHARDHRKLQGWLKNRNGPRPKVPQQLLKSYYYIGTINAQIWINYPTDKPKQNDQRFRRARSFLEVCALYEYDIDKTEERLDKIEQIRQLRVKRIYHHHWRLTAQFMSYQESATLSDVAGEETIYSTQRGLCVGGQWGYGNAFREWTVDGCVYNVRGNVATEQTTRYFQKGITTIGLLVKPTYWKLLNEGEAGVGLGVTALLRKTDYSEPADASVKSRLAIPFGLSLEGRWKMSPHWHFTSSAGYMDASMLWSFGLLYDL